MAAFEAMFDDDDEVSIRLSWRFGSSARDPKFALLAVGMHHAARAQLTATFAFFGNSLVEKPVSHIF